MRRLIAYITMAFAILVSIGATFNLVFSRMNPGREFTNGREIVYRLSSKDEAGALKNGAVDDVGDAAGVGGAEPGDAREIEAVVAAFMEGKNVAVGVDFEKPVVGMARDEAGEEAGSGEGATE